MLVFVIERDGYLVVSSLNSLTLTLIAIATKLPVDLTTSMPSAQDKLSKLTGTIFICICMGFFMPSLGSVTESECMSNMASLSMLVITVLKSGKEMKRLTEKSMAKVPNHLIQLLHQIPPSQESLTTLVRDKHEICSLSIAVLARTAALSMPSFQSQLMFASLEEVFEVVYYINHGMSSNSIKKKSE
ncbi:hypothetical protein Sjap_000324 [Stephania japonica]|uniref:Uncharacterized protein n=1 Tax=Stephania japonica TaxID=461633 RepID=A0AAP0PSC7_9MAGN